MGEPLERHQVVSLESSLQIFAMNTDRNSHEHVLWSFNDLAVNLEQVSFLDSLKSKEVVALVSLEVNARLNAADANQKLTNWAGNLTYSTDRLHEVTSADQIRALLLSEEKWKVLGSRHCFNSIADSRHNLLSLKPMHDVVRIDAEACGVAGLPGTIVDAGRDGGGCPGPACVNRGAAPSPKILSMARSSVSAMTI